MPVSKHRGKKKRKPAARKERKPSSAAPSAAADRRMMEKTMDMLSEAGAPGNADNALRRAQELIYDTWETPRAIHRIRDAVEELLRIYEDDYSANWHYSKTLLAFRKGDELGSRRYLAAAWQFNPHVPPLLIGAVAIPSQFPDYYSPGSPDEAVLYVQDNRENWAATEGALPWLAEAIQTLPPPKKDRTE